MQPDPPKPGVPKIRRGWYPTGILKKSPGKEIGMAYANFFINNKVGWQIASSNFMTGCYLTQAATGALNNQKWNHTQLWVHF